MFLGTREWTLLPDRRWRQAPSAHRNLHALVDFVTTVIGLLPSCHGPSCLLEWLLREDRLPTGIAPSAALIFELPKRSPQLTTTAFQQRETYAYSSLV